MPRRKLYQDVMGELLDQILGGEFGPGDKLPREVDVAEAQQVSRYVVREANQALEERGVVEIRHGIGAIVMPSDEWDLFDLVLLEALLAGSAGRELLAEAVECRTVLEPEAAALAATRRSEDELEGIRAALEQLRAAGPPGPELDFHRRIVGAAGNRFIRRVLIPLDVVMAAATPGAAARKQAVADCAALVSALEASDPDAARDAMRARLDHLAASVRRRR